MAEINTGYKDATGKSIVWDTKSSAGAKRDIVGDLIKAGVMPQTIKNLISQNDPDYKNDATYRAAADKILQIDEQFATLSNANQTNQGISAITPSRSYSIYGVDWNPGADIATKQGYIQTLLAKGITPTEIREALTQYDPQYRTDATYRTAADSLLFPAANTGLNAVAADIPTSSRIYNIGGLQWNSGASLDTKRGYVQSLLRMYTPDQIKSIIKYNDPANATDEAFQLLGLPKGAPTSAVPTGFRAPYEAPTQLAPSRGLGQLVSQYVGQPNLRTMTRSIGPGGMGVLTEQPSAGLSYATRPGGIGESQYFKNIANYFANPSITPQSTAYEMSRYNIPETDIQAAIGMTPTEFFAQKQLAADRTAAINAAKQVALPQINALAAPSLTYGGAPSSLGTNTGGAGNTVGGAGNTVGGAGNTVGGEGATVGGGAGGIGVGGGVGGIGVGGGVGGVSDAGGTTTGGVDKDYFDLGYLDIPGILFGDRQGPDAPIEDRSTPEGAGGGGTPPTREDPFADDVVQVYGGGPIALAEGGKTEMAGEKKFSFEDFGITPATVELARKQGVFDVPRNVVFGPELKGLEAAALANMSPADREMVLREMIIRQGLTGREYFPESMFGSTSVAPAIGYIPGVFGDRDRDEKGRPLRAMYRYAEGGGVGRGLGSIAMKGYAQEMAQKGRFGDTMLAHISPEEAQMLQAAGGAGTINPQTGLPEFFSWRKTLKGIAKVAPFIVPFIPGLGLAAKALISGVAGGLGGEKGFDFKRGLMSGLMSYGIGSAAQNLGLTSGAAPTGAEAATAGAGAAPIPSEIGSYEQFATKNLPQVTEAITGGVGDPSTLQLQTAMPTPSTDIQYQGYVSPTERMGATPTPTSLTDKVAVGLENLQAKVDQPIDTLYAVPLAVSSAGMVSEGDKAAQAMAAQEAEEKRKKRVGLQAFETSLGLVPFKAASGGMAGLGALAAGGATGPANEPRTINGAGDGMSDSVPATIEGVQEARLADGEFVIPADVVADLGNGSSNAGSKKLYAMMDRVRKARHGTTRQPPEVDTGRLMPA